MSPRAILCAALAGALGCSSGALMEQAPPPVGWTEEIAALRQARDREMREDPDTPLRPEDVASFRGLDYWPADARYRFSGPVVLNERLERFSIVTTTGKERPCEKYGRVRFRLGDQEAQLLVYRLLDTESSAADESFFLPFTDGTTGKESYPAGRYVDLVGPKGGPYVLDFNRAYNPSCAYGAPERFACPVTPAENRLPFRVEAGERGYKHAPGKAS